MLRRVILFLAALVKLEMVPRPTLTLRVEEVESREPVRSLQVEVMWVSSNGNDIREGFTSMDEAGRITPNQSTRDCHRERAGVEWGACSHGVGSFFWQSRRSGRMPI
jgi:hypothetical protein